MSSKGSADRTLQIVLVVIAVLVLAPMLMMVVAFPLMGAGMGMWGGGMMGGYGVSSIWSVVMLVVWLLILVGGGVLAYRWLSGERGRDQAFEELRLAYARGDLSDEEFEERRARLKQG